MRSTRNDKVLLQSVKTLTFHKDGVTKARRTSPIREYETQAQCSSLNRVSTAQLVCKSKACKRYQPDVVQCTNTGDDGLGNVQWKVSHSTTYPRHNANRMRFSVKPICRRLSVSAPWRCHARATLVRETNTSCKVCPTVHSLGLFTQTVSHLPSGSCGLEYNLIRIDPGFEAGSMPYVPGKGINWGK